MNDLHTLNELQQTELLCAEVDGLFGAASEQGRMLSLAETMRADELSRKLIRQIRALPHTLSGVDTPIQTKMLIGETLGRIQETLRRVASPLGAKRAPCAGARKMAAYMI